ncbi:DUF3173 domain-containing protein [Lactococcus lactis subsp. lactis]|uniref:DUF3173 domain-containing protein n=1 Tax=Lactococcus lactis TaxID=1358 RepID=UPI00223A811D|nr:DUF3173 domain-containing protein [Lactococcus lactis]MCT0016748.1 DUF3173 domain-containing protein [Lactococcus lactis subsp. lactis]
MIPTVNKEDVMRLTGYGKTQSQYLIRIAKKNLVNEGLTWYKSKGVGRVPTKAVEEILGYSLFSDTITNVKNVADDTDRSRYIS